MLLHRRLPEVKLTMPDLTVSGVEHATFTATLHDVSQPEPNVTKAGSMDAAITIGFASLPDPPKGQPVPKYSRAEDGSLAIEVTVPPDAAKNVRTKLYLKMAINGHTITSTPQRLTIFGRTLPAEQVGSMTGGVRKQQLPSLPAGLNYQSITPESDGLHVALAGVSTTPLNQLPTDFAGQTVSYSSRDGLLGISTSFGIEPIINIPLTIYVEPKLTGSAITMQPRSVQIFGANRPPSDLLAKLVLSQIKSEDLTQDLPALPAGIRYRSVRVDEGGIKVVVSGVTVQPYSTLPKPKGATTTYGADKGLLTVTTVGSAGRTMPVKVYATPTIKANKLEITPQKIAMFDTLFPAADVFAELKPSNTAYDLQALPTNLHYKNVELVPTGIRLNLTGKDVTMGKDLLGAGC
ncbi:LmeA family phospholipid-binding protein [Paractinoplanes durhamensis]|uniref:LmeA family phospholipid-binding protein n=1 Tax=Paractinoplanes durhamensis TaxID=113563 RepID=UPI00362B2F59